MSQMDGEPRPLEQLAAELAKAARLGPRRHAAVHAYEVMIRNLGLRTLEDFDNRIAEIERRLNEGKESHDGDS